MVALPADKLQRSLVCSGVIMILLSLYTHFKLAPDLESKLWAEKGALEEEGLKLKPVWTEINAAQARLDKAGSRDVGNAFVSAHEEYKTVIAPLEKEVKEAAIRIDSSQKTVRQLLFQLHGIQVVEVLGVIAGISLTGFGFLRARSIGKRKQP